MSELHAVRSIVSHASNVMMVVCHTSDMKQYCSTVLPYVSDQPVKTEQLTAALFEANALSCALAHSSEIDWSQQAPAAKRSRQVRQH